MTAALRADKAGRSGQSNGSGPERMNETVCCRKALRKSYAEWTPETECFSDIP
jgi:hypothetical protein